MLATLDRLGSPQLRRFTGESQETCSEVMRDGEFLASCTRKSDLVEADAGDRMIILVSDGMSSDLSNPNDSLTMADDLSASNITLFHVHVGTSAVPATVQELARETGGEAFVATDRKGLERVFRHIDQLQPDRFAPGGTVPMDFFLPFATVSALALGLHVVGLFGGRHTPW